MAATKDRAVRFSDDDVLKILELTKGADSVELKLTVPSTDHRAVVRELGMDPLDAQIRQVFFFDTPALDLNEAGVVARARRIQGKGGDTVVKLRPVVPEHLSPELRRSPGLCVEVDAMPGGFVCSGSLKGRVDADTVKETVLGDRRLRKLFTKEQRAVELTGEQQTKTKTALEFFSNELRASAAA